jgi:hypothetical protein
MYVTIDTISSVSTYNKKEYNHLQPTSQNKLQKVKEGLPHSALALDPKTTMTPRQQQKLCLVPV